MIAWLRNLLQRGRPQPEPEARVERVTHELVVSDTGELVPVIADLPAEKMMPWDEAERWLDENVVGWRRFGPPPCHVIGDERLVSEIELAEWLSPSGVTHRDPRTGEISHEL